MAENYCGCCGNVSKGTFCLRCRERGHLGPTHLLAWDRTYAATHGFDCPYQISFDAQAETPTP